MDARNALQWSVAILVVVGGISFPVFAGTIEIYSGDFNLPIPKPDSSDPDISKGWMDDAVIDITDHFIIYDLDVGIRVAHTNVIDLQIFLRSPSGTRICLNMFDVYGLDKFPRDENYKDYTGTIFDDEAQGPVKEAEAPFTGRFRPIDPYKLSEFDGEDIYGAWRLQIYDAWAWDTGTLDSFKLIVTAPEPITAILLLLGTGLISELSQFLTKLFVGQRQNLNGKNSCILGPGCPYCH
jgi:subtilisin-like proprotein convertase family protein